MADISKELNNIMAARYGKDVRQSIHDGIKKINEIVDETGYEEVIGGRSNYRGEEFKTLGDNLRSMTNESILDILGRLFYNKSPKEEFVWNEGFIQSSGNLVAGNNYRYSNPIEYEAGTPYILYNTFYYKAIQPYIMVGESGKVYRYNDWPERFLSEEDPILSNKQYDMDMVPIVLPESGTLYINAIYGTDSTIHQRIPIMQKAEFPLSFIGFDPIKDVGNELYGKKWAVCGDSFTDGGYTSSDTPIPKIETGKYAGMNKVYGYLIGNRNNMEIQHLAAGGRTMATPADGNFSNCFSKDIYKTIDKDTD